MTNNPIASVVCGTVLLLAVLAGIFVLVWHGSVTGEAALAVVATIVGIGGGAFAVHTGTSAGAKAATRKPTSSLPE